MSKEALNSPTFMIPCLDYLLAPLTVFLPKSKVGHQFATSVIGVKVHFHQNRQKKVCVYGLLFPLQAAQIPSI